MSTVVANPFVLRQTAGSPFSYFLGTWEELCLMTEANLHSAKPGYRDGVILVPVNPERFLSGVVQLTEGTELCGSFKARRKGETPRKQVLATGATKLPAKSVDIVLYRGDVLGDDASGPADGWEIISINANPTEGEMPIDPMVLLHNHFGSDGGTDTNLSDSELVAMLRTSFDWWRDKAMCG